jgi:glutamine synthetase adenylyltransferase
VIPEPDANHAIQSYNLLRRIETALRRFENKNVPSLPVTTEEQKKLANRLDYADADLFAKEYRAARETIHSLYERNVKANIN